MTVCDHRRIVGESPVSNLMAIATNASQWSGSDRRSIRAAPSVRMPAATPRARARRNMCSLTSPVMPMASEALSPARAAQLPQLLEAARRRAASDTRAGAAQHGAGRDAHRGAVGVVVGQRVGDLAGPLPTDPRRGDVAVGRPRAGAHVPAVGGVQVAGGLQMFGDQRRILVRRPGLALLDRGGQAPVHLGAIGFQLRFVGHRADQRVAEGVLGARGEPHLIDQLRTEQLVEHRIDPQRGQKVPRRSGLRSPTRRSTSAWPRRRGGRCAPRWPPAPWPARSPRRHRRDRRSHRARRPARRAAPTRAPSPRRKTGSRRPGRR